MGKNKPLNLPYPLVLASTSKYRGELLSQLGWEFEMMGPGVDEEKVKLENHNPTDLSLLLSKYKAEAVFVKRPDACVIGSDQVLTFNGHILGKPGTIEKATEQISLLQGNTHELITAVTIIYPDGHKSFVNKTKLKMRNLTLSQIHAYVKQDLPLDCAGSYKLESKGIKLFEQIEMNDHTSIIGLPLIELTSHLLNLGYSL